MSTATGMAPAPILSTVRQLVLHLLFFILLMVFTSGLASLLTSVFQGFAVDEFGSTQLPLALAQTIIAGPLAWILWRQLRRFLSIQRENSSLVWSVQAAAVYALAAMISVHNFSVLFGQLAAGRPGYWQDQLGLGVAWGVLAFWQHRILRQPDIAPQRLPNLGWQVASYYFLLVAALSLAALLYLGLGSILPHDALTHIYGAANLPMLVNICVWVLLNALMWAWHWFGLRLRFAQDAVAQLALVVASAVASLACLLGSVFSLASVLPLPMDAGSVSGRIAQDLPLAAGFALAGALAWVYFTAVLAQANAWLREAGRQVVSGIALVLAASGFGMIINALLTAFNAPLMGNSASEILRVGTALLLVGVVSWLVFWRPAIQAPAEHRRVYLTLVFGVSALVALVALIVVGYRIFAYFLTPEQVGPTLLGEVRAALGLLIATTVVAGYHFAVWRSDRSQLRQPVAGSPTAPEFTAAPPRNDSLIALTMVTDQGNAHLAAQLQQLTGLPVQHLIRTDASTKPVTDAVELSSRLDELPPGTRQALLLLHGEEVLIVPVEAK